MAVRIAMSSLGSLLQLKEASPQKEEDTVANEKNIVLRHSLLVY